MDDYRRLYSITKSQLLRNLFNRSSSVPDIWKKILITQHPEDRTLFEQLRHSFSLLRQWGDTTVFQPGTEKKSGVSGVARIIDANESKLIKANIQAFRDLEGGFFKRLRTAMDQLEYAIKVSHNDRDTDTARAAASESEDTAEDETDMGRGLTKDAPTASTGQFDVDHLDQAELTFMDMPDTLLVQDLLTPDHPQFETHVAARLGPVIDMLHSSVMAVMAVFPTLAIVDLIKREQVFETHLNHLVNIAHQFIRVSLPLVEYALSFDKQFVKYNLKNRTMAGLDTPARAFYYDELEIIVNSIHVLHILFCAVDVHLFPFSIQAHPNGIKSFCESRMYPGCIITGSHDTNIRIWELNTGEQQAEFVGHRSLVSSVCITSDDRFIVSASFDQSIRIWNTFTAGCVHLLKGAHSDGILTADLSPDDKYIVSGGMDRVVVLWDFKAASFLRLLAGHQHWVRVVRFSPDSQWFVSGGLDGFVLVWNVKDVVESHPAKVKPRHVIEAHKDYVLDVAFGVHPAANQPIIASTSRDGSIKFWNYVTGEAVGVPMRPNSWALSVSFSANSRILAAGSLDSNISLYDTMTQDMLRQLKVHNDGAQCVKFSGKKLLISTADGQIQAVDAL
ncbi:WD domain G-beta repeat [Carpediemonas membranifera]|uniref:WD domain G-beta repeat n=1 Tax=Carpediemonas membranifera TaxID=201153 RepID=A0A8J6BA35_9EUKA|nr:WD domain G-beta repeat [Carpediemonas membranifera]|eukprot:KAG9397309.1 WD domain G-beta repeat [Carpediemonas membranifera]